VRLSSFLFLSNVEVSYAVGAAYGVVNTTVLLNEGAKGYWRMSRNSLVSIALNNTYLAKQEVPSLRELWVDFKYGEQANV